MGSPSRREELDQQLERELKTVTLTIPADHDQNHQHNKTTGAAMVTKTGVCMVYVDENLNEELCSEAGEGSMVNVDENALDEELWHRLPEDVLPKIFVRLPLRSLLKIRLLSKSWADYIQSHSFQLEATSKVLSTWESFSPVLCSSSTEQKMRMVAYSRASGRWESLFSWSYLFGNGLSSSSRWQVKSIFGSLLCLKQVGQPGEKALLVTNPVLQSFRVLPPHGMTTPFLPSFEIMHIVNSEEEDSSTYRVISISQDSRIRDPYKRIPYSHVPHILFPLPHLRAEIYDSATGDWTVDHEGGPVTIDLHNVSSVYVDGVVYFSLSSTGYESVRLFAYDVMRRSWTPIPYPDVYPGFSLVQLVRCGKRVMLVLCFPSAHNTRRHMQNRKFKFGAYDDLKISEGSISVYEIMGLDLKTIKISGGPTESIQGVKIVEGISGDEDSIYLQAFGRPIVVVFNVKLMLWSTVAVGPHSNNGVADHELVQMSCRYIGPSFNWTSSSFQPGLNLFMAP
ncbi:unnamed protein product [Calypogeia fissa]